MSTTVNQQTKIMFQDHHKRLILYKGYLKPEQYKDFIHLACELAQIREKKLFKPEHESFKQFAEKIFEIHPKYLHNIAQAGELINASELLKNGRNLQLSLHTLKHLAIQQNKIKDILDSKRNLALKI